MIPEYIKRMQDELKQLRERKQKLFDHMQKEDFTKMSTAEQALLDRQYKHMYYYEETLTIRLELAGFPLKEEK